MWKFIKFFSIHLSSEIRRDENENHIESFITHCIECWRHARLSEEKKNKFIDVIKFDEEIFFFLHFNVSAQHGWFLSINNGLNKVVSCFMDMAVIKETIFDKLIDKFDWMKLIGVGWGVDFFVGILGWILTKLEQDSSRSSNLDSGFQT